MEIPVLVKLNGMAGGGLLSRPLMTMDGHLLSAFWNKGSCIPDKSIDKEDIINELIDEVLMHMKLKSNVDQDDLLDLLRNHRRGSTASSKRHGTGPKAQEKQRRSWGPDDTWSSRFVNTFMSKNEDKNEDKKDSESETINEKQSKSSSRSKKHSKKTYQHANTESVLSLRSCQPLNRYQNRGNSDNKDDEQNGTRQNSIKNLHKRRKELMKMMSWICDEGLDYIHTEQAKNMSEVEVFLDVMMSSHVPVQMTLKVNSPTDISITYQFLPTFKEEYMILNISKTHCMVMRAF